jgi:hypothetical protein
MMSIREINGLRLPPRLTQALSDGTWTATGKNWPAVFPPQEIGRTELFRLEEMLKINGQWRQREIPPEFHGEADGSVSPGNLEPESSLLLGEIENEALFALDYRPVEGGPRVVFLNKYGRWLEIATTFDDFWHRLTSAP